MDTDRIIVAKRLHKNGTGNPEWISIDSIAKIEPEKIKGENKIVITSIEGVEYFYVTTIDMLTELLSQREGYVVVDRGRLANLNHEVEIDYNNYNIRFKKVIDVVIGMARSRVEDVKKFLRQ